MMFWKKVKIDKADSTFSLYLRLKYRHCVFCGKPGKGEEGITGLEVSHFFSRGKEGTRFFEPNCDVLCKNCHSRLGHGEDRDLYKAFKIDQLGQDGFNRLLLKSNTYKKKDRRLDLIVAKELLNSLTGGV